MQFGSFKTQTDVAIHSCLGQNDDYRYLNECLLRAIFGRRRVAPPGPELRVLSERGELRFPNL